MVSCYHHVAVVRGWWLVVVISYYHHVSVVSSSYYHHLLLSSCCCGQRLVVSYFCIIIIIIIILLLSGVGGQLCTCSLEGSFRNAFGNKEQNEMKWRTWNFREKQNCNDMNGGITTCCWFTVIDMNGICNYKHVSQLHQVVSQRGFIIEKSRCGI